MQVKQINKWYSKVDKIPNKVLPDKRLETVRDSPVSLTKKTPKQDTKRKMS